MFSVILRRLTFTNVAMTVALVFAMSGGAYAAKKYVITSTKQISPKVLKALKGSKAANGAPGSTGAPGPVGPQGPTGTPGAPGVKGETGVEGKEGKVGKEGKTGATGSPWPAGGTLPSGSTETGVWSVTTHDEGLVSQTFSFPIPLSDPVGENNAHLINPGEEGTEECPGTVEKPEAEAGQLCVYAQVLEMSFLGFGVPHYKSGMIGSFAAPESPGGVGLNASGTWAVTAP